jgi:hypothetical protein
MKKKTSLQLISVYTPLLITVFSACILLQTGCNNSGEQAKETTQQKDSSTQQKESNNWISMDITFKPNTDEEFREKAIRDIEKMWIKEASPFMKKYDNLYPSISVTKFPFLDTLKYRLSLLSTFYSKTDSGEPKLLMASKVITPCPPCPGLCPACDSTRGRVTVLYNIAKMDFDEPK